MRTSTILWKSAPRSATSSRSFGAVANRRARPAAEGSPALQLVPASTLCIRHPHDEQNRGGTPAVGRDQPPHQRIARRGMDGHPPTAARAGGGGFGRRAQEHGLVAGHGGFP